jgi:proline racemase
MCGHDTIGVCTALVESGLIPIKEPITSLKLDTPAGLVEVDIFLENGKAKEVSFCNIPAFLLKRVSVDVEGIGRLDADIAYGGNFYAIIDAKSVGLDLIPENASNIIDKAINIRNTINEKTEIVHPQYPFIRGLTHVEFFTEPTHEEADVKNTVIVPPGGIDRSPCGTGTSAKLAVLYANQEISIGEEFVHESIVGSLFRGRVLETTDVEGVEAVVTKIAGSAWLMGMHRFFYHEEDPLKEGFLLIPPMEHETEDVK